MNTDARSKYAILGVLSISSEGVVTVDPSCETIDIKMKLLIQWITMPGTKLLKCKSAQNINNPEKK